jgi:lipoic acid synthetase
LRYLKAKGIKKNKVWNHARSCEQEEEVYQTMRDLREANVDVVTIGQYLQPSKKHLVKEFITQQFAKYEQYGQN